MVEIDYKQKYHKYKNKYLQIGKSSKFNNHGKSQLIDKKVDKFKANGSVKIKNSTIELDLGVNGGLKFLKLKVGKSAKINGDVKGEQGTFDVLSINGSLKIVDSTVNNLKVHGGVKIKNVVVTNTAKITGSIVATSCTINKLKLVSDTCHLINSKINEMIVDNVRNENKFIIENSTIDKVVFERGYGKIYLLNNSKISEIINGEIVKN